MLEGMIGRANMYKIVKAYLEKFAYSNADIDDLLTVIDQVGNEC
jgi:aminopeptidase N